MRESNYYTHTRQMFPSCLAWGLLLSVIAYSGRCCNGVVPPTARVGCLLDLPLCPVGAHYFPYSLMVRAFTLVTPTSYGTRLMCLRGTPPTCRGHG